MPRRSTHEVAEIIADRLVNRGAEGSPEWVLARVLRWGTAVASITEHNPTYVPLIVSESSGETFVHIGPDRVPHQVYREWVDVQDGSRKVIGDKHGRVVWAD